MQEEGSEPWDEQPPDEQPGTGESGQGSEQPPDEQPGTGELEVLVPESGTEEIVFDDSELDQLPPGILPQENGVEVIDLGDLTGDSEEERKSWYNLDDMVYIIVERAKKLDENAGPDKELEKKARERLNKIIALGELVNTDEPGENYLLSGVLIEKVADELTQKPAEEPKKRKWRLYKNVRVAAAVLVGVAIGATIYEVARNGNSESEKAHYIDEKVDEDSHFEIVDGWLEIPASIDRISVIQGEVDERDYWLMHSRVLETVKLGKDAEPGKVLRAKQKLYEDAFEAAREKVADGFKVRFKEKEDERGRTILEATVDLYRIR